MFYKDVIHNHSSTHSNKFSDNEYQFLHMTYFGGGPKGKHANSFVIPPLVASSVAVNTTVGYLRLKCFVPATQNMVIRTKATTITGPAG